MKLNSVKMSLYGGGHIHHMKLTSENDFAKAGRLLVGGLNAF